MRLSVPGIVVRISHLLVVQVIFIFSALALLLFWKPASLPLSGDKGDAVVTALLNPRLHPDIPVDIFASADADLEPWIASWLLRQWRQVTEVCLVESKADSSSTHGIRIARVFGRNGRAAEPSRLHLTAADTALLLTLLESPPNNIVKRGRPGLILWKSAIINGHRKSPALLAMAVPPAAAEDATTQLVYPILLLFLISTLISLLGVYLITTKFREPLARLSRGMEKTADGELHYLVESTGDRELDKLTVAFNRMSRTLWSKRDELIQVNRRLTANTLALLQSYRFLSVLIESDPSCIIAADHEGRILLANRAARLAFGDEQDTDSLTGRPVHDLFCESTQLPDCTDGCREGPVQCEIICRRSNGERFPALLVATPLDPELSRPKSNLYILRDISESKSFQEMMIRLDRYYTRGEMAGEIAHEMNNYLAIISGNLELLSMILKKGDMEKVELKLKLMRDTVDKIARFTGGLLDGPHEEPVLEPISINQLIENVIAFLKPQNKFDTIDINTALDTGLPPVKADVGQLQQLLVNLIFNAADALETQQNERLIVIASRPSETNREEVIVTVSDRGPGVLDDKVPLLFNKRFTTKRHGHGIGLITCKRIVERHGGRIGYRFDHGAVFEVILPISSGRMSGETSATAEDTEAHPSAEPRVSSSSTV